MSIWKFILNLFRVLFGTVAFLIASYFIFMGLTKDSRVYQGMFHRQLEDDIVLGFVGDDIWFMGELKIVVKDNSDLWNYTHNQFLKRFDESQSEKPDNLLIAYMKNKNSKIITYSLKGGFEKAQYVPSENLIFFTYFGDW